MARIAGWSGVNGGNSAPFGAFDTPMNGSAVSGSIAVTGWALDDNEVTKVEIKREPDHDDTPGAIGADGLVYIGDALFVRGSRPDVEAIYPDYPYCNRAGWGYLMLTYGLPRQGNGAFRLYAFAEDGNGNRILLGIKEIMSNNADRVQPFGAIDTPAPGEVTSGNYLNFGWVLTPPPKWIPTDGSTIWISIDSIFIAQPDYNHFRQDIYDSFPGYLNSNGAVGYFYLDTTQYTNGTHTIGWYAVDSEGLSDGFGSRFFEIQNPGGETTILEGMEMLRYIEDKSGWLKIRVEVPQNIEVEELGRIEIKLKGEAGDRFIGWGADENRSLPVGSTLDEEEGIFYWNIGPGFLNKHVLHFATTDGTSRSRSAHVVVNIVPKRFDEFPEKVKIKDRKR
jgi:hypothetical protein